MNQRESQIHPVRLRNLDALSFSYWFLIFSFYSKMSAFLLNFSYFQINLKSEFLKEDLNSSLKPTAKGFEFKSESLFSFLRDYQKIVLCCFW